MVTKEMLESGRILVAYSEKYLLSVNPAFGIDKVRFSLVKQGTGGKDASDVYLDAKEMHCLCRDIETGVFTKKIAADAKNNYPSAYVFVKGEKGSKKLAIGGGEKGIRVQSRVYDEEKKTTDTKTLVVPYDDFVFMVELYNLLLGKTYFREGSRLAEWYNAYFKNVSKHAPKYDAKADDGYIEPASEPADKTETSAKQNKDKNKDLPVETFILIPTGENFTDNKGFKVLPVTDAKSKERYRLLLGTEAQKQPFYEGLVSYLASATKKKIKLTVKGQKADDCIRLTEYVE